ncbi:type II toxin-antitoxin system RelE/ParE family toxin [Candidatus Poribacteria bacterium]|nr:type II toxin-antitoxin system RelE/ParE family toxin [Candidatus Poribacteria bacterium]
MGKRKQPGGSPNEVDGESQKGDARDVGRGVGVDLRIYQEGPGDVPFLRFFEERKDAEKVAIRAALGRLRQLGNTLRPPLNEHLGEQIYYLRIAAGDGHWRVFYWPFGRGVVILGHGFSKKTAKCPPSEIKRAMKMKQRFAEDPVAHTYRPSEGDTRDET